MCASCRAIFQFYLPTIVVCPIGVIIVVFSIGVDDVLFCFVEVNIDVGSIRSVNVVCFVEVILVIFSVGEDTSSTIESIQRVIIQSTLLG